MARSKLTEDGRCRATGKVPYTRREAMERAAWWRRTKGARMSHYRCRRCGLWHIGNNRWKPRGR